MVPEARWVADAVLKVEGIPMRPNPKSSDPDGDVWIEETVNPNEQADHDLSSSQDLQPRMMSRRPGPCRG